MMSMTKRFSKSLLVCSLLGMMLVADYDSAPSSSASSSPSPSSKPVQENRPQIQQISWQQWKDPASPYSAMRMQQQHNYMMHMQQQQHMINERNKIRESQKIAAMLSNPSQISVDYLAECINDVHESYKYNFLRKYIRAKLSSQQRQQLTDMLNNRSDQLKVWCDSHGNNLVFRSLIAAGCMASMFPTGMALEAVVKWPANVSFCWRKKLAIGTLIVLLMAEGLIAVKELAEQLIIIPTAYEQLHRIHTLLELLNGNKI